MNMKKIKLVKKNVYFAMIFVILLLAVSFVFAKYDSTKASHGTLYTDVIEPKTGTDIGIVGANLGIGTTSPDGMLDVRGYAIIGAGTGENLILRRSGDFRIRDSQYSQTGFENAQFNMYMDDGIANIRIDKAVDSDAAGTLTIQASNVGIGTISPTQKLDVAGNIKGLDFHSTGSNSWIFHTPDDGRTTLYVAPGVNGGSWDWSKQTRFENNGNIYMTGNVGIGTTTPREKLEVDGNINASGTICGSNGCIGEGGGAKAMNQTVGTSDIYSRNSWEDMDNMSITLNTNGGNVLVMFSATIRSPGDAIVTRVRLFVDGVEKHAIALAPSSHPSYLPSSLQYLATGLSAGSHEFKIDWRTYSSYHAAQIGSVYPRVLTTVEI